MDSILALADWDALSAISQVIFINVVLSADNAIVIGMAAIGVPAAQRMKVVWLGIILATVMRIGFALVATGLLEVFGLLLAGGILLLWVSWKMWRDMSRVTVAAEHQAEELLEGRVPADAPPTKTVGRAMWQIIVADLSMSLDNVLAVAGAALGRPTIMIAGLAVSVLLMGFAATLIARLLERYRWIAYAGLAMILYVAAKMIWHGAQEVLEVATAA